MADTAERILAKARETLDTAALGLHDFEGADPARRMVGLRNLVVFGRSVTFVLQTLRRVDRVRFDAWYAPHQKAMQQDALLRYFNDLRTSILKEGGPETSQVVHIWHLDTNDLAPVMANPPPGAKSFFMGDRLGGSGWEVELPDGTVVKYYVALPAAVRMEVSFLFPDPPTEHGGQLIADTSVSALCHLYIDHLSRLLVEAETEFAAS